jgi:hypothetical protein
MKLLFLALLLGAEPVDFSGIYACTSSSDDETFSGVCLIRRLGDTYAVAYTVYADTDTDGTPETMHGVGIQDGDTFAVGWAVAAKGGIVRGVTRYRITGRDGGLKLSGRWVSVPGPGVAKTEELRRVGAVR